MKILVVYNPQGDILFTQTNVTEDYFCLVEDVADNKEIIGVDTSTNNFILADRLATTEEKEILKKELETKEKELESKDNELVSTKQELLNTQATLVETTYNNLLKENGGL